MPTRPNRPARALTRVGPSVPTVKPVEVNSTEVPPAVLAKLGEAFAGTLSQVLAEYRAAAPSGGNDRRAARFPGRLERLERLGVQVQQVARVLSGHGHAEPEGIDLAQALEDCLRGWEVSATERGASIELIAEPAPVLMDPAVLDQLVSLGIAYALEIGERIVLRGMAGEGERPTLLAIEAHRAPGEAHVMLDEDEFDDLHWLLLSLLARAAGMNPQRIASGQSIVLTMSFPRSDVPMQVEAGDAALPRTPIAAGHRVLVVDADPEVRMRAREVLSAAGLHVDAVPTLAMARGAVRDRMPEVLISGGALADAGIDNFVAELRDSQPGLHWIELVDEPNIFAVAMPGSHIPTQLSRTEIKTSLLTAVSQQIDLTLRP